MNNKKYLTDYDDFDKESQKILLALQKKVLTETLTQSNLSVQRVQSVNKVADISEAMSDITDWLTDEYIDLERLIIKIKAANSGMNDYQFAYNPKDLNANIQNKSIQNKSDGFIQLKVYRNPKVGNVSVKWKDSRIIQKIDLRSKKIYYRLHFYYANSTETAFILETSWYRDFRDLNILLNYGDIDKYEADYNYFLQNFASALRNTKEADRLKFIYENIPEFILKNLSNNVDNEIFFNHLENLSKDDDSSTFRDSSAAVIQIFKAFGSPIPILNYFRENPAKLNRIYYSLDKSGEYNGKPLSNRIILANIMMIFSMFAKNTKQKKTAKTFTIGKGYKVNGNILEGGIFQKDGDNYRDTFFLQQQKEETVAYNIQSSQTMGTSGSGERTITTDIDEGAQYYPLDMVYIKDISGEKETLYFVPAIYMKALADAQEWEVVLQNIRMAADIVAVIIGVLTLPTGNPYFLLLAIADISLAGADFTIQAFKEEILKYEGGKEFLEAWEKIYIIGGALTAGALVVSSFYKIGLKLLTIPEVIKSVKLKQTIAVHIISVLLDVNLVNFERNSVKILTQNTEIVAATNGSLNDFRMKRLFERECFLVSGNIEKNEKLVEEFALVYKGEVIAQGNKVDFYKQIKELGKNIYNDKKLESYLESVFNRRKTISLEEESLLGQPPKSGTKMLFSLVDELGNRMGQLSRSPNRNELYYKLIQNGKEIDLKCYMKLLDDKYKLNGLPIKDGEHLLYGDFNIPKEITDKMSGLGQIMYEDGLKYFLNAKKYGKVDGTVSVWIKADIYNDYGGQSVNLDQFWIAKDAGLSTEKAAFETFAGKQAKKFGFSKVRSDMKDKNFIERDQVIINFLK
ncbi:hypothetical protein [Chryseobacterium luteum]|uniref:Uncharacterized protein n=1 Tax=Chryseobacterium luteum TaxID=421531 RepID=A0A085ZX53_9FLAO|nr:hypothetical protein [Chryseobacterium luteum]KFF09017.1 hypothetical protein IX38_00420 [Chryseobacterium luteum]